MGKREEMKYEIGWCGQNASLAVSFLYDYQMNGNKDSLKKVWPFWIGGPKKHVVKRDCF